ncbi:toxin-antitoxin system YwqK family antitoxin [Ulvibacter antarcticus]|uniref:Antitoxin component YwqK of YwqJK toxin-antitoxin module n=1 Tax=Ulvibacter antarcticus TaxID=442714 RepID=A0A3L9YDI9_9FLAO|nr:toxin-antitoxin system YwqK family antitoxin [Ulvibacter antarcticus]RMA58524.1 antitoxin component YwqK of YwqJK toxin-antitoxin module [Ulvibacter antarcticus]
MRLLFIFFFGIIFSSAPLIAQADINQLDAQGNRHGLWKKMHPGNKQIRYEGTFDHGKEVGTFKFYCEDCKNQPMVIKEFNTRDAVADVQYFTVKGKLVSEGKMDGKNRVGEWLYYQKKSKTVMTRENYNNGNLDGQKITYYPDGKITEEITYVNGSKEGPNNYYSPIGVLLKKLNYKNDALQGEAMYYDSSGNVTIEGQYKKGKKDGLWKYYKNGKVELEETYPKPLNIVEN